MRWVVVEVQENLPQTATPAETREEALELAFRRVAARLGSAARAFWKETLTEQGYFEQGLYCVKLLEVKSSSDEPKVKLVVTLYDACGNPVDTSEPLPVWEAQRFVGRFMELHGTDPDEDGAGAQKGRVKFIPVFQTPVFDVTYDVTGFVDGNQHSYRDKHRVTAATGAAAAKAMEENVAEWDSQWFMLTDPKFHTVNAEEVPADVFTRTDDGQA